MDEIEKYVLANTGVIAVQTFEEVRFIQHIAAIGRSLKRPIYVKFHRGWRMADGSHLPTEAKGEAISAKALPNDDKPGIYVFLDGGPEGRALRERVLYLRKQGQTLIFVSPFAVLSPDLAKDGVSLQFKLPTETDLNHFLITEGVEPDKSQALAAEAKGLTHVELLRALSISKTSRQNSLLNVIKQEKERAIRSSGLLEIIQPGEMKRIGGLDLLKNWLKVRRRALEPGARVAGLPIPKGVLILGPPGTGKSECAKAVAGEWQRPLIKLDPSRLYAKHVGDTEANVRQALQLIEATEPCVLWIDEIEKGLAGGGNFAGDSGVSTRLIGTLLTWMQEREGSVFVVATANAVEYLPPELLRKGRFDEVFFVDLPSEDDRGSIFEVVLSRHGLDTQSYDTDRLAELSSGFSGAEVEEAVRTAMYEAYAQNGKVTTTLIAQAVRQIVPLSATAAERITNLRAWAIGRARPAALGDVYQVKGGVA